MTLIVYRCYDTKEEEACFLVADADAAKAYLDTNPPPPEGFGHRAGYYFFEEGHEAP